MDLTGILHPPCSTGATDSIWSGLGGFNQNRLIQDSTDSYGNMWWQAIAPDYNTYEVLWPYGWAAPGDAIESLIIFDTTYHDALFYLFDLNTGISQDTSFSSLGGHSAQDFYEGTTADFISESPGVVNTSTGQTTIAQLARPTGNGIIYFPYAETNGEPIAQFYSWRVTEKRDGVTRETSGYDGVHAWYNTWQNC
jgi:hypothetical protein